MKLSTVLEPDTLYGDKNYYYYYSDTLYGDKNLPERVIPHLLNMDEEYRALL